MSGPVLLAGDRQTQSGKYVGALFAIVWGGMFAGIPIAILLHGGMPRDGKGAFLLFPVIGLAVFLYGLYIALRRQEVWFDPRRESIEVRESFLGRTRTTPYARKRFDRVHLRIEVCKNDSKTFKIELLGGGPPLALGAFSEHGEALTAGMRAARRAGLAFEEKQEAGPLLRLEPDELARVPAAPPPQAFGWWRMPAPVALVLANLVPVLGVLLAGWHIFPILLLFWMENVVVGAYTLVKMLLARGPAESALPIPFRYLGNLFICAFFAFHYGMFCLVHGVFVAGFFGPKEAGQRFGADLLAVPGFAADLVWRQGLVLALLALIVSHGVSFYVHYLRPRAFEDAEAGRIMPEPYKRVVILHVVILLGAFLVQATGSGVVPLLLLIGLKTVVDLTAHRREHAMPFERSMRDYMREHGKVHLTVEPPAPVRASPPGSEDRNDVPLAHYLGAWAVAPDAPVPAGWIARAEFREEAGRLKARLRTQGGSHGGAFERELVAAVRGDGKRVEFIDVRTRDQGVVRIARFTGSDAGAGRIDLNEIQHPEGRPNAMQARSSSLRRA